MTDISIIKFPSQEFVETQTDKSGTFRRIVTDYFINEKGQKVKKTVVTKVSKRIVKINKKVEERKKWKKIGECANLPDGTDRGVTNISDPIFIEPPANKLKNKDKKNIGLNQKSQFPAVLLPSINSNLKCRNCQKIGHWTKDCPYPKQTVDQKKDNKKEDNKPQRYRPPARQQFSQEANIRVSHLSEDTTEEDLTNLFYEFGEIMRISLVKDKNTGKSRCFAFINFFKKSDAELAIQKMNGTGHDYLILNVEWAKSKNYK